MRLPAHLLLQLRVGVGVGAVLLAGCDLVDDVKGAISGEAEAEAIAELRSEAAASTSAPAAKPSGGLAGKVARALDEVEPEAEPQPERLAVLPKAPADEPDRSTPRPELEDEPEDVTAFVPFGGTSAKLPPRIKPRIKPRPSAPIAIAPSPDEPCDPAPSPRDPCPACGRG